MGPNASYTSAVRWRRAQGQLLPKRPTLPPAHELRASLSPQRASAAPNPHSSLPTSSPLMRFFFFPVLSSWIIPAQSLELQKEQELVFLDKLNSHGPDRTRYRWVWLQLRTSKYLISFLLPRPQTQERHQPNTYLLFSQQPQENQLF